MDFVKLAKHQLKIAMTARSRESIASLILFAQYAGAAQALKQPGSQDLYRIMDNQIDKLLDRAIKQCEKDWYDP